MKFIAVNGTFLVMLAIALYIRAASESIDQTFLIIQIIEFIFGLTNMVLLGMMIRDGRVLTGKIKRKKIDNEK